MMQSFDVEIHSVESQQVLQIVKSPLVGESAAITRVPEGTTFCLETLAQKLLMVPFDDDEQITPKRTQEEVQIARRLGIVSSRIYIASKKSLSCILETPWVLQADSLLDANRVEEALSLSEKASSQMDDMHFDAERLVLPLITLT
jgi:hypothetical protein